MVNILKKDLSILIYEKEKILNSILHYQITNYYNYNAFIIDNDKDFIETAFKRKFDSCILNLNYFSNDCENLHILQSKNKFMNIIAYHDPNKKIITKDISNLFLLETPFKLINLINYLDSIKISETFQNSPKYLMDHIIFSPSKKTISNLKSKHTEHLTEKENNLLFYFYNKKNKEILKKDLLTKIWGVSDKINTHTFTTRTFHSSYVM